jgi:hypothetical protein
MPISSFPLFLTAAGSSALMDLTSETLRVVCVAAPLETWPMTTSPDLAAVPVEVAASLLPPQAATPVAREATAVAAVMPRIRLRRVNWVGRAVPGRWR